MEPKVTLQVKDLKTHFKTRKGIVKAVDGVSFDLHQGEIFGVVGESGCGKSVTAQTILGLVGKNKHELISGEVLFEGENLLTKTDEEMRQIRGKDLSVVFQDPMTSLNPLFTVGTQIAEVPRFHDNATKQEGWSKAVDMLGKVNIPSPSERASDYPFQFSGGMRQRGVIAMSLICNPRVLIADEPTTALDVTIQAQILDLLRKLRDEYQASIIIITHDLGVVAELCDTVAVMYAGSIVEKTNVKNLFKNPRHPYTKGLLASLPRPKDRTRLKTIDGQPPDLHEDHEGCLFAMRCSEVESFCETQKPLLKSIDQEQKHQVACFKEEEVPDAERISPGK